MKVWVTTLALLAAAPAAAERTHTVVKGEYLWKLAGVYYGNHFRWKAIYAANTELIKDPHWIYPGQVLVIPGLPDPRLGELGARPVEAAAPAILPAPVPPAPAPEVARAPAPEPVRAPRPPAGPQHDLSVEMPPQQTSGSPFRYKRDRRWREQGRVTPHEGREVLAAAGDAIHARMRGKEPVPAGARFSLYRRDAVQQLDIDKKAVYLEWIGVAEVEKALDDSVYRLRVLKSRNAVLAGDLLEREGS